MDMDVIQRPGLWIALVAPAASGSLSAPFVWDDPSLIEEQEIVRELQPLSTHFTRSFWSSRYDSDRGFFRPFVTLSHALEWRLWDGDPAGFHRTNLFLHLLDGLRVFLLTRKSGVRFGFSLLACLFFGLFPRLIEVVRRGHFSDEERQTARTALLQFGLCASIRAKLPALTDDAFEARCRPLSPELSEKRLRCTST